MSTNFTRVKTLPLCLLCVLVSVVAQAQFNIGIDLGLGILQNEARSQVLKDANGGDLDLTSGFSRVGFVPAIGLLARYSDGPLGVEGGINYGFGNSEAETNLNGEVVEYQLKSNALTFLAGPTIGSPRVEFAPKFYYAQSVASLERDGRASFKRRVLKAWTPGIELAATVHIRGNGNSHLAFRPFYRQAFGELDYAQLRSAFELPVADAMGSDRSFGLSMIIYNGSQRGI